jgi:hypothetical protein
MNKTSLLHHAITLTLLSIPFSIQAESWSCRHGNDVREIHIQRASSAPVPCSVVYKKLTEGVEDQVLWSADNDESFCDQKAREFVARQESWGWTCVETIQEKSTDDAVPADTAPADEAVPAETAPADESPEETAPGDAEPMGKAAEES